MVKEKEGFYIKKLRNENCSQECFHRFKSGSHEDLFLPETRDGAVPRLGKNFCLSLDRTAGSVPKFTYPQTHNGVGEKGLSPNPDPNPEMFE